MWESHSSSQRHKFWTRTISLYLWNILIVFVGFLIADTYIIGDWNTLKQYSIDNPPEFYIVVIQTIILLFITDIIEFVNHILLHSELLYRFHSVHHEHYHTSVLSVFNTHPIELITVGFANFYVIYYFREYTYPEVILLWLLLRLLEVSESHCGYAFPWSMFLLIPNYEHSSIYHSYHHSHNSGNYASILTGLDTLCGTNKDFKQHKLEEQKKLTLRSLHSKIVKESNSMQPK